MPHSTPLTREINVPIFRPVSPWTLLLATYLVLLAIGSLYPFSPWRADRTLDFEFLFAPWPARLTRTDILTNLLAYFPLGVFAANSFFRHRLTVVRWLMVCLGIALLSAGLETTQHFLPHRVSSNVDVFFNLLGGALGAAAAPLVSRRSRFMVNFVAFQRYWFQAGWLTHAGLILLGLWGISQLSLQAPGLVAGGMHGSFIPFWHEASVGKFRLDVMLIFALDLASVGLFGTALLQPHRPRGAALFGLMTGAIFSKFLAAAFLVKLSLLGRLLSLEAVLGLGLGFLAGWAVVRHSGGLASLKACATALSLLILVKLYHGIPFVTATGLMPNLATQPELLFNITGLAYLVAEAWPYLALGCVLALWERQS